MIGQEGVVRAIVRRLKEVLPQELAAVARAADVQPADIEAPQPENIFPYWINLLESMDRLPAIMVMVEDTDTVTQARQVDIDSAEDEYAHQYPLAVVIVNTGEHYGHTELNRQRLMLGVRNTLLRKQLLIDAGNENARIDPDTLRESLAFGAQNEQTKQYLLESVIRVVIRTHETLDVLENLGTAVIVYDTRVIEDQ